MQETMLAIVGSPGSGKTTLGTKLAMEIARSKKNVLLIFCDPFTPPLPFLLSAETSHKISLGSLLTAPAMSQQLILDACVTVKQSKHVSFLGYRLGENLLSFPQITKDKAVDLLVCARHLADYVIVDCAGCFEADMFSMASMDMADRILWLETADLKGISFYHSHKNLIQQAEIRNKGLWAIGNCRPGQESEAVGQQYGGISYTFEHVPEILWQSDEVSLLERLHTKEALSYQWEMQKLLQQVFALGITEERNVVKTEEIKRKVPMEKERKKAGFRLPSFQRKGEF